MLEPVFFIFTWKLWRRFHGTFVFRKSEENRVLQLNLLVSLKLLGTKSNSTILIVSFHCFWKTLWCKRVHIYKLISLLTMQWSTSACLSCWFSCSKYYLLFILSVYFHRVFSFPMILNLLDCSSAWRHARRCVMHKTEVQSNMF